MASLNDHNNQQLYNAAHLAGMAALEAKVPEPMLVQQHARLFDDDSPVTKSYTVPGGVCGFAWIIVRPANCSFAKWTRKKGFSSRRNSYSGGEQIFVHVGGQSYEKKMAYAGAFTQVLRDAGIKAHFGGRLD